MEKYFSAAKILQSLQSFSYYIIANNASQVARKTMFIYIKHPRNAHSTSESLLKPNHFFNHEKPIQIY